MMDTNEFDAAVVAAVFTQAGLLGWRDTSLVDAARDAELDLARLRVRFPSKTAVLLRFGVMADQAALAAIPTTGTPRDRLFDAVMARFDQLQAHRDGVLALMEALRFDPATALLLYGATLRSMKWMLEGAAIPAQGVVGQLRIHGLLAVWTYALRAWERDEGSDLPATMAAVDRALDRALQAEALIPFNRVAEPPTAEPLPSDSLPEDTTASDDLDPAPTTSSAPSSPTLLSGPDVTATPGGPRVI